MRDYGKVAPTFWTGETGKQLRKKGPETQLLALYLLTCQSAHMTGLFYLPLPTLCHETGLTKKGACKALARVSEVNFAHYDEFSEVVWVPEMAHYQVGESLVEKDNRHKGILKYLESYRKSRYYKEFYDRYQEPFHLPNPSPLEAPCKGRVRTRAEQEQEQEQEQDIKPPLIPQGGNSATIAKPRKVRASILYCSRFEAWWLVYPRKENKAKAHDAWKKAGAIVKVQRNVTSEAAAEYLLERVTAYAASPRAIQSDPDKIPHPSTWLSGGRYDDDPKMWQTPLNSRGSESKTPAPRESHLPYFDEEEQK